MISCIVWSVSLSFSSILLGPFFNSEFQSIVGRTALQDWCVCRISAAAGNRLEIVSLTSQCKEEVMAVGLEQFWKSFSWMAHFDLFIILHSSLSSVHLFFLSLILLRTLRQNSFQTRTCTCWLPFQLPDFACTSHVCRHIHRLLLSSFLLDFRTLFGKRFR